jgi:fructose-bisphosphate aldolase class 1
MEQPQMNAQELIDTANALVADDKGLLAMDESNPTCNKRFAKLGIPQTEETRRAYRELIVTTPGLEESISGAILYNETMPESFPASKSTPAQRIWPVIPERKSPKVWTACATGWLNTPKWARALPSGAR